jgi:hypothetical protein
MKMQTREFKLASPAIDNTYSRFRDPAPRATLMLTDNRGVDWIVVVKGESALKGALALTVGDVMELHGNFSEKEVITNNGRGTIRTGEAVSVKQRSAFTKTKSMSRGKGKSQGGRASGFSLRIPKRQPGWMAA